MKTRQILSVTIAALLALSALAGCKRKTENPDGSENPADSTGQKEPHLLIPDSPASDFSYTVTEKGNVRITRYTGSAREISIPSQIAGHPVTVIDGYAFQDSDIVRVKIADSVTDIRSLAFLNCKSLEEVELPESLNRLGYQQGAVAAPGFTGAGAFAGCSSLKGIWIPDGVTQIDPYTFEGCTALESARLPASLTTFEMAFALSSLKSVQLEEGLELIDEGAFDFTSLETLSLPASVETIGSTAFAHTSLKSLEIPSGVKVIGSYAFEECAQLESLSLSEGLTELGGSTFAKTGLRGDVTLPKSLRVIDESDFAACPNLERLIFLGDAPDGNFTVEQLMLNYAGRYSIVYQPQAKGFTSPLWMGYPSVEQGKEPEFFDEGDCRYLEQDGSLTLLQYLGDFADGDETGGEVIQIPETVRGIPVGALGRKSFAGRKISGVILPKGIKSVGDAAFCECLNLRTANLPDGLESIGDYAFCECFNLETVALPSSLKVLGAYGFAYCESLKELDLSSPELTLGEAALSATGLIRADLPEGLEAIPKLLFWDCENLAVVSLPQSLRSIGDQAFVYCRMLRQLDLPQRLETVGNYVFNGSGLTEITLPDSVREIGKSAFAECPLEKLDLGHAITSLGDGALAGLKLDELIIPASVQKMSADVFATYSVPYGGEEEEKERDYDVSLGRLKFEGDAPEGFVYFGDGIIICHHEGASGFTGEDWENVQTEIW